MKTTILFCILSHTNPLQIKRLVNRLIKESISSKVLVCHDCSKFVLSTEMILESDTEAGRVLVVNNHISSKWGSWQLVQTTLNAINIGVEKFDFDWFYLLSGQDYPLIPISSIEKELAVTSIDGYIEAYKLNPIDSDGLWNFEHGILRYYYKHFYLSRLQYYYLVPERLRNALEKFRNWFNSKQTILKTVWLPRGMGYTIAFKRNKTPFSDKMKCHWGSQWFIISKKCVDYLLKFMSENKEIIEFYRRTFIPDESMIQTILKNNDELSICNDNRRYICFESENEPSPKILTINDADTLLNSGKHFARKLDMRTDKKLFDLLDRL